MEDYNRAILLFSDLELANMANIDLEVATNMINNDEEITLLINVINNISVEIKELTRLKKKAKRILSTIVNTPELSCNNPIAKSIRRYNKKHLGLVYDNVVNMSLF